MTGPPRAVVIVVSSRAADGTYEDRTGPVVAQRLSDWGYAVTGPPGRAGRPDGR